MASSRGLLQRSDRAQDIAIADKQMPNPEDFIFEVILPQQGNVGCFSKLHESGRFQLGLALQP